jgi:hypothetical protein
LLHSFKSNRATLNDAIFELAVKGFSAAEGVAPEFPGVLLNDVVHRFIYHNDSVSKATFARAFLASFKRDFAYVPYLCISSPCFIVVSYFLAHTVTFAGAMRYVLVLVTFQGCTSCDSSRIAISLKCARGCCFLNNIIVSVQAAHRVDSLDMPKALRGWPELGLALGLLHDMDHYARNCLGYAAATSAAIMMPSSHHLSSHHSRRLSSLRSISSSSDSISSVSGSSSSSSSSSSHSSHYHRVCVTAAHRHLDAQWSLPENWPSLAHAASRACATSHHRAQGRGRDGKEFHARKLNELPLRRADLARRVLGLAASHGHGNGFFGSCDALIYLIT